MPNAYIMNKLLNHRIKGGVAGFDFGKEANFYTFGIGRIVIIDKAYFGVSKSDGVSVGDALKTLLTDIEVSWAQAVEGGEARYDFDGYAKTLPELRLFMNKAGLSKITKTSLTLTNGAEIVFGKPRLDYRFSEDSGESTGIHKNYEVRMDSNPIVKGDILLEMVCLFAYIFGRNLR